MDGAATDADRVSVQRIDQHVAAQGRQVVLAQEGPKLSLRRKDPNAGMLAFDALPTIGLDLVLGTKTGERIDQRRFGSFLLKDSFGPSWVLPP